MADGTYCESCGLKPWDADDLQPGDMVCVCDDPFDPETIEARDARCWTFGCRLHLVDRVSGVQP